MGEERLKKWGIAAWYLLVLVAIVLFLYSFALEDPVLSVAAFILAMVLSKYKDKVTLPGCFTKEENGIYK